MNISSIHEDKKFDGTHKKILDSSIANKYGWIHKVSLEKGLSTTINDYLGNYILKNKKNN